MNTPRRLLDGSVIPALTWLATVAPMPVERRALVPVMAIAGQESNWEFRRQIGGPARSYWQFEQGGGLAGLLAFPRARDWLRMACASLDVPFESSVIFEAMAWNDSLAAVMARLLLWTDPHPLPEVGQQPETWDYYIRNWRPGLPHPEVWPSRYLASMELVT